MASSAATRRANCWPASCAHTFGPCLLQAPQAGEIASFLADEGQPVEYGEDVVELAPFFGGLHWIAVELKLTVRGDTLCTSV